jgi:hypothetical protein
MSIGCVHRCLQLTLIARLALLTEEAGADHPGPLREAALSPLTVGLLAGGLALVAGLLVVVVVMLLARKEPPA